MGTVITRPSLPADVPRQRELWALAFGDSGDYVDNFYHNYYRPERILVLEEDGTVQAMTAWFDTAFVLPSGEACRAGYLYAVATYPDCRGQGFAGRLLRYAGVFLQERGFGALTTVPAKPSLHSFFAKNGFRECFVHAEHQRSPDAPVPEPEFALEPVCPMRYGQLREAFLHGMPHIVFPQDALEYQAGCCRLSGGGLYVADTGYGAALLCAEGMENGRLLLKELLGEPEAKERVLACLPRLLPKFSGLYRCPGGSVKFGMLRWLEAKMEAAWDWSTTAYMGFGFD